jgi:hypothetical protein
MAKPEIVSRAGQTDTPRVAAEGRSTLSGTYYRAVSCSVCFAFHGGDKVGGEKVYEYSELGSEMPARRP